MQIPLCFTQTQIGTNHVQIMVKDLLRTLYNFFNLNSRPEFDKYFKNLINSPNIVTILINLTTSN